MSDGDRDASDVREAVEHVMDSAERVIDEAEEVVRMAQEIGASARRVENEGLHVARTARSDDRFATRSAGNRVDMAKSGDVHVVPSDNGWKVELEGTGRARSTHATQREAAEAGRDIAKKNKSELLIHGRNGRIRERSTYGRDPRRSKG